MWFVYSSMMDPTDLFKTLVINSGALLVESKPVHKCTQRTLLLRIPMATRRYDIRAFAIVAYRCPAHISSHEGPGVRTTSTSQRANPVKQQTFAAWEVPDVVHDQSVALVAAGNSYSGPHALRY